MSCQHGLHRCLEHLSGQLPAHTSPAHQQECLGISCGVNRRLVQAAEEASNVLCEGVRGVVAAMRSYPAQRSLLPWQDMFVDLVQGRLQSLFLSLLACETLYPFLNPSDCPRRELLQRGQVCSSLPGHVS